MAAKRECSGVGGGWTIHSSDSIDDRLKEPAAEELQSSADAISIDGESREGRSSLHALHYRLNRTLTVRLYFKPVQL